MTPDGERRMFKALEHLDGCLDEVKREVGLIREENAAHRAETAVRLSQLERRADAAGSREVEGLAGECRDMQQEAAAGKRHDAAMGVNLLMVVVTALVGLLGFGLGLASFLRSC